MTPLVNQSEKINLQVFAHEYPFSQIHPFLVPGLVLAGRRPSRPADREILGLSDDLWALVEKCWAEDPTVRPKIANILPFLEAASSHWALSTSNASANLNLNHLFTLRKPLTGETTCTTSGAGYGSEGSVSRYQSIFPSPYRAWGSLPLPMSNKVQQVSAKCFTSLM